MSQQKIILPALSLEQLEAGLLTSESSGDRSSFWDENILPFRQTLIEAIDETADALRSPDIPSTWQRMLEEQIVELRHYVELADRYIILRQGLPQAEARRLH